MQRIGVRLHSNAARLDLVRWSLPRVANHHFVVHRRSNLDSLAQTVQHPWMEMDRSRFFGNLYGSRDPHRCCDIPVLLGIRGLGVVSPLASFPRASSPEV